MDRQINNTQVGCVLLQEQPIRLNRPIVYWSITLSDSKKKQATTDMVNLSAVCEVLLLDLYLEEDLLTFRKDHEALKGL